MIKTMRPNYDRSVLSITNSILAHYNLNPYHKTLPELNDILAKKYKNVVFMIFDGLGSSILKKHLGKNDFLYAHKTDDLSSVFPPTTTASTISMRTGLSPIEHGWLGWSLYFNEIDKNVNIFTNVVGGTKDTQAAEYNVAWKYIPHNNIFDRISEKNSDVNTEFISPFAKHQVKSIADICNMVRKYCDSPNRNFLLTYWDQPDEIMHRLGTESEEAHIIISDINQQIEMLSKQLSDTLLIITADHSMIDTEYKFFSDFPSISECLVRPQSIEARAANFFVKQDKKELFETEFNKYFGEDYVLLTREQVLEQKLFGMGIPNKKVPDFLGDYLAVAIGKISIDHARPTYRDVHKAQHAGLSEEEMLVPLIILERT